MTATLAISKWSSVFERAESRKLKTLSWVSLPITVSSNGFQAMLDEFGDEAPAIYGAWCALLSVAAQTNERGVLANGRGIPLKTSHIARLTGFPQSVFERLIDWASSPEVGWLVEADSDPDPQFTDSNEDQGDVGGSPGEIPTHKTHPHPSEQDKTSSIPSSSDGPDRPPIDGLEGLREKFFDLDFDLDELDRRDRQFRRVSQTSKSSLESRLVICVILLSATVAPTLSVDLSQRLRDSDIRKPPSYVKTSITKALDGSGVNAEHAVALAVEFVVALKNGVAN